jgi:sugar/nucleoside kinase (ribokinase family)
MWTFAACAGQTACVTDVLVVGDANPDLILRGDVVPRFGQAEQLLSGADLVIGGSGAIVAHGLARLGVATRLVAATGKDPVGDLMERMLSAGGVDTSALVREPGVGTGFTVVLSAPSDRAVLTHLGVIPRLSAAQVRGAVDDAARAGARHVHVASYFLLTGLAPDLPAALADARSRGLTTSLDTNFDPAEKWAGLPDLLPHLDLFLPNRTEVLALATRLTGAPQDDAVAAARALAAAGPTVVVKDGADGAFQVDPSGDLVRASAAPADVVDTTGAGDTFDAAYLEAFLRGLGPAQRLRRACLAGALSTAAPGGTAAQPTPDQLSTPEEDADVLRH